MQAQRFRSPSVRGALSAVKASLGLEAPVLSTQFAPDRPVRPPDSPATAPADTAGGQEIMAATGSSMASALFGELGIPVDSADGSAMEASCV